MPHIIVEYSRHLEGIVKVPDLVQDLHIALAAQGVDETSIVSRARVCDYVSVGVLGSSGHMLHTMVLFLRGRDSETKHRYGKALYDVLKASVEGKVRNCAVSLEVRDMDRDTYFH